MYTPLKYVLAGTVLSGLCVTSVMADPLIKLRIQNHHAMESTYGTVIKEFVDNVSLMSGGDIEIEMFYSSAVVKSAETFDAATTGILDCDMTNGSYQTGKDPAFQFVADTMGGYDTPLQYHTWVNEGGGKEAINELYAAYGMTYIGAHVGGQESLSSIRPLRGIEDLDGFKFRSPPGMESEIFASLGAKPVVMDFTEIFTALETRIIDGADAASISVNRGLGIYDIAKYTTFPGFHSMSADHLACSTKVWEKMTERQQKIMTIAQKNLAMDLMMRVLVDDGIALAELPAEGVEIHNWSAEDRDTFRKASQAAWDKWASRTPQAEALVNSHIEFSKQVGLIK